MRFQELLAYQKSFELAMHIFEVSRHFPSEEKYSLTDQVRRSSRSVSANIAEASRKRQYLKHFLSKLSDSDSENSETQVWLEYAHACRYINFETYTALNNKSLEVGKLLYYMMANPQKLNVAV